MIASDVGGLPEALGGLDPSLVVPAGDADRLARRIELALARPEDAPRSGTCRRRAETFSWQASALRHADVYRRAELARRGSSAAEPAADRVLDHCALLSGGELALVRLVQALGDSVDPHVILGEEGPLIRRLSLGGVSSEVLPLSQSVRETTRHRIGARVPPGREAVADRGLRRSGSRGVCVGYGPTSSTRTR